MTKASIIKQLKILRAQNDRIKAQNESMNNTLAVLEKELAGSGAPASSTKRNQVIEKTNHFIAKRRERRNTP